MPLSFIGLRCPKYNTVHMLKVSGRAKGALSWHGCMAHREGRGELRHFTTWSLMDRMSWNKIVKLPHSVNAEGRREMEVGSTKRWVFTRVQFICF